MSESSALKLADALTNIREARECAVSLAGALTPAQAGCVLRLKASGLQITLDNEASERIIYFSRGVLGLAASCPLMGGWSDPAVLERVAGPWFDIASSDRLNEAIIGYWLADMFIATVNLPQASELTRFLAGQISEMPVGIPIVRRYPTGGVSEKQALILPALIREVAKLQRLSSSFLVAPKLAHTGGTRDKLSVIPGFKFLAGDELGKWNRSLRPVVYFAGDSRFCSRDALMYRLRGETGTVADLGLMSASIMSKQLAAPADLVILDIIYGPSSFLRDEGHAIEFSNWCLEIATQGSIVVETTLRYSSGILGRGIGASLEIAEAVDILCGRRHNIESHREWQTSLGFMRSFSGHLGYSPDDAEDSIQRLGETSGARLLAGLWREHGASPSFLQRFEADSRLALLEGLSRNEVRARGSGLLRWNPIRLADYVNNQINQSNMTGNTVARGGVDLVRGEGEHVEVGQIIATIFYDPSVVEDPDLSSAYSVG